MSATRVAKIAVMLHGQTSTSNIVSNNLATIVEIVIYSSNTVREGLSLDQSDSCQLLIARQNSISHRIV